ncbi:MAG TPA: hypothetical protein VHI93_02660 [Candidatus Thermoplasmatota archaeon]|nr:hypothetical protein [Candidatus Thermoplasmatota archaeon]
MDPKHRQETAIDPLALVLRPDVYVRINLPYPAPETLRAHAREAVKGLNAREREQALESVGNLVTWARAVEQELRTAPEQGAAQVRAR